jgi:uncharacterized cupin superfamily protein
MTKIPNLFEIEFEFDDEDPEGYRAGAVNLGKAVGAATTAIKLFTVPAGESICPYHYEYEEEWLLLLAGSVVVRTPEGEQTAEQGALMLFPAGPAGAHKVTNPGSDPALVLMFSSANEPSVAVYPDSDKIGVWPGNADDHVILRRGDGHVDYYDGEP